MLTAAAATVAAAVNLQSRPIPIAGTRRLPDKSDFNGELELQWSLLGAVSCGLVRLSVLSTVAKTMRIMSPAGEIKMNLVNSVFC